MRPAPRILLATVGALAALAVSYGLVFSFYVSGLFGDGRKATPLLWETALRRTVLLSPFVAAFLILAVAAWRAEWSSGILPWGVGATGVLLIARWDAGVLGAADPLLFAVALLLAWRLASPAGDREEDP